MKSIQGAHRTALKSYNEFREKHGRIEAEEDVEYIYVTAEFAHRFSILANRLKQISIAREVVPRSFVVSLVSQYDAFLGRLLAALFLRKPDILKGSESSLSFSQLSEFASIDEALQHLMEQQI